MGGFIYVIITTKNWKFIIMFVKTHYPKMQLSSMDYGLSPPWIEKQRAIEANVDAALHDTGSIDILLKPHDESVFLESFQKSVWVYSTISMFSEVAAQVPLKIYKKTSSASTDVTMESKFKVFKHPNPWTSRYRLWEATFAFLKLIGSCYWEVSPNKNNPEFIYLLRPDLMRVELDEKTNVKTYWYYTNGVTNLKSEAVPFSADNIVHFKSFNPTNFFYGMSSLSPLQMSIAADLLAMQYQIKFYENNARPDGVFSTESWLSDPQIERYQKILINFRQKLKGAFTPLILHGGLKYQPISSDLKNLGLNETRKGNRQDILSGQRTPPILADIEDVDSRNPKDQLLIFMYTTILPVLRGIAADLDTLFLRYMGANLEAFFDIEDLPEYVDYLGKVNQVRTMFQNALTSVGEARKALRLQPLEDEDENNQRFILSTLMKVENSQSIEDQNVGVGGRNQARDSDTRNDDDGSGSEVGADDSREDDSERE